MVAQRLRNVTKKRVHGLGLTSSRLTRSCIVVDMPPVWKFGKEHALSVASMVSHLVMPSSEKVCSR